jgi:hypothetical protein
MAPSGIFKQWQIDVCGSFGFVPPPELAAAVPEQIAEASSRMPKIVFFSPPLSQCVRDAFMQ